MGPDLMLAAALAAILTAPAAGQSPGEDSSETCLLCHGEEGISARFGEEEVPCRVDPAAFAASVHGRTVACTDCHEDIDLADHPGRELPARPRYVRRLNDTCFRCHGGKAAHPTGLEEPPLCTSCHGAHSMRPAAADRAGLSRACAVCHTAVYATFSASVHGANPDGRDDRDHPQCVDCHAVHAGPIRTATAHRVRMGQPCIDCHSDAARMALYRLSPRVVTTYFQDFHGTTLGFYRGQEAAGRPRGFDRGPLVCADCHGVHDIGRTSGAGAAALKRNLVGVCRECHPGASDDFPGAWLSHYEPSLTRAPLVFLTRLAYYLLIPFIVGGLVLQIALHLVVRPLRARRMTAADRARLRLAPQGDPPFQFDRRQNLEHWIAIVLFTILLLTGLPQKFHEAAAAEWIIRVLGGIDAARWVHRVAGILFAGLAAEHIVLGSAAIVLGWARPSILPGRKDVLDAIQNLNFYLGISKEPPRFGRFEYRQKFEYWGLVIGGTVMILSGFILYFPQFFAGFLPAELIPVAKIVHSFEALLAFLVVTIWHMYGVFTSRHPFWKTAPRPHPTA